MRKLLVAIALTLVGFVGPLVGPLAGTAHADTTSDEAAFVAKINQLRASLGLGQLTVDANLTNIARGWAQQMANAGDISHNPDLRGLVDSVTSTWAKLGENVGLGPTVDALMTAFINSPHHYANLTDPSFTHIGVGVVMKGSTMFTSHEFMALKGGSSSAAPTPAPTTPRVTVVTIPRPRTVTTRPPAPPTSAPTTTTTTLPPPPPVVAAPVSTDNLRWMTEVLRGLDPNRR